jgi:cholesterol transport system auxiliary component
MKLSRRRCIAASLNMLPLVGCSRLLEPPRPQIYRLNHATGDQPLGPALRTRLVIDLPTASESLDTDRIALIRDRTRFDYFGDSAWTDRAPVLVQGLLVEAFENNGRIAEVARDAGTMSPDYVLGTELRDFEARYEAAGDNPPAVVVGMALSLVKMPDRRMTDRTMLRHQVNAVRNDLDSIVEAFDVVVGNVLAEGVAWTLRAIGRG